MSVKILSTMYGTLRTDDESTDGCYIIQWTNKLMKCFAFPIIAHTGEIDCDAVFLNHVPNTKYWVVYSSF